MDVFCEIPTLVFIEKRDKEGKRMDYNNWYLKHKKADAVSLAHRDHGGDNMSEEKQVNLSNPDLKHLINR